jgi:hypothetical protein
MAEETVSQAPSDRGALNAVDITDSKRVWVMQ